MNVTTRRVKQRIRGSAVTPRQSGGSIDIVHIENSVENSLFIEWDIHAPDLGFGEVTGQITVTSNGDLLGSASYSHTPEGSSSTVRLSEVIDFSLDADTAAEVRITASDNLGKFAEATATTTILTNQPIGLDIIHVENSVPNELFIEWEVSNVASLSAVGGQVIVGHPGGGAMLDSMQWNENLPGDDPTARPSASMQFDVTQDTPVDVYVSAFDAGSMADDEVASTILAPDPDPDPDPDPEPDPGLPRGALIAAAVAALVVAAVILSS